MNRTLLFSIVRVTALFYLGLILVNPVQGALVLHLDASDPSTIKDQWGAKANEVGFMAKYVTTWNE